MAEGDSVRTPFVEYKDYKKDSDNYVWVKVDIKGLKKKFLGDEASNAQVKFEPGDRSITLSVTLNPEGKRLKAEQYEYNVKRLPEPIDPDKSYYKVKNNEVTLFLRKVNPGSWARHLANVGLETAEPAD